MRKNQTLILMLLSLFCLFSCSDDEKKNELSTNYISFYGRVCPLQMGVLYHDVDRQVLYSHEVKEVVHYLDSYSENAKEIVDTLTGFTKGAYADFTGNFMLGLYDASFGLNPVLKQTSGLGGAAICIRFASSSREKLMPGKYTYSTNNDANTFIAYSSIFYDPSGTNLAWAEKGESALNELVKGEIDVKEEENGDYTIQFDLVTVHGGSVKGQFQGKLESYDIRPTEGTPKIAIVSLKSSTLRAIWDGYVYASDPGASGFELDEMHVGIYVSNYPSRPAMSIYLLGVSPYNIDIKPSDPDILLCYIPDSDYYYNSPVTTHGKLFFESPLFMRAWTRGQFPVRFTCHTRYAPAPDFTMERFNNLQPEDLLFSTTDERYYIEESECRNNPAYFPKFFYVETGNGRRGVICVTGFQDIGSGPSLIITVKFADIQQVFSKMR